MIDLDSFQTTIEVRYKGKGYKVKKIKEKEKAIYQKVADGVVKNDMSIYDEVLDFIIDKFKEADPTFPEQKFRDDITFDMITALFTVLGGTTTNDKKK